MKRCIVNVSIGRRFIRGQQRLRDTMRRASPDAETRLYQNGLPVGCPNHSEIPFAFKPYALKEASAFATSLLWCDSCIIPGPRPMEDLWQKIERDGYWISHNGFSNYEWTADGAYQDLFPDFRINGPGQYDFTTARIINRNIPHVVATAFGISTAHQAGAAILEEYFRLAKTKAFCGPWINQGYGGDPNFKYLPADICGPEDVRGHRHDQTALSVIAWRVGCQLTRPPEWFAYTGVLSDACLIADGSY